MTPKRLKDFEPGHGFTREDWDDVCDTPELTDEQLTQGKPFSKASSQLLSVVHVVDRGSKIPNRQLPFASPP